MDRLENTLVNKIFIDAYLHAFRALHDNEQVIWGDIAKVYEEALVTCAHWLAKEIELNKHEDIHYLRSHTHA